MENSHKYNLLYVDDEESNLRVFNSLYRREFSVFVATSAREGLKLLDKEKIDLIISDQRMPEITGIEFLREAKIKKPELLSIILTGFSDFDVLKDAINEIGVYSYITKPFDKDELRTVMLNALEVYQLKKDKKISDLELVDSEIQKRSIIDSALDGIIIIDIEGKVLDWNAHAEEIFGWTKEEALGKELVKLIIPEEYKTSHSKGLMHYKKTGEHKILGQRLELEGVRKNGDVFPVELTVTPIELGDRTIFSGFLRDISDRKKKEQEIISLNENLEKKVLARTKELQQNQVELEIAKRKADAANEAKTTFLANMSHEIRSPLNAIVGFSEILINKTRKIEVPGIFKEYLKNIVDGGRNLSTVINDILDLSKIEAGKMELSVEDVDIDQLIRSMYHINKAHAMERGIKFSYDFDARIPKVIRSDRTKVIQILMNFLSNALKFTDPGKEVIVMAKIGENEKTFELIVEDHGIGIEEEALKRIFEPFEQVDAKTTRKYGGTGLGLTITKKIIELLDGDLKVTSEVGKGSIFTAVLPLEASESPESITKEITFDNYQFTADNKILVVEDNPMNRKMLKALFEELDLKIELAINGLEAIQMTTAMKPDLVLMDIHMPVMDGIEAVIEIRRNKMLVDTPIVALSADAFKKSKETALKAGFNDFLSKPIEMSKLLPIFYKYLKSVEKSKNKKGKVTAELKQEVYEILKKIANLPIQKTEDMIQLIDDSRSMVQDYEGIEAEIDMVEEAVFSGNKEHLTKVVKKVTHG